MIHFTTHEEMVEKTFGIFAETEAILNYFNCTIYIPSGLIWLSIIMNSLPGNLVNLEKNYGDSVFYLLTSACFLNIHFELVLK